MGCILSSESAPEDGGSPPGLNADGEIYVYVPGLRTPKYVDLKEHLQDAISADLASRLQYLRSNVLITSGKNTPASKSRRRKTSQDSPTAADLEKALVNYLPALLGFVAGGEKWTSGLVFEWTNVEDEKKETALGSVYYELLSVLHLLGMLALQEANVRLTSRPPAEGYAPKVTEESKRNAIEILLKAASYFDCALRAVLPNTPEDIKAKLPADLSEPMLIALEHQALGHGVELQLSFAVDNIKASLAVKRRLACEHVQVWKEANERIEHVPLMDGWRKKLFLFLKWKLTEAKAGAYYFHGLILNEGYEENTHAQALMWLKAAHKYLKDSQRIRLEFSTAEPTTKVPEVWGPIKYFLERIPREAVNKSRVFRENYREEKLPIVVPKLPEFPLALIAEPYHLPPVDPAWEKESGYEGIPTLTPDIASFLAKKDPNPKPAAMSDLRRAWPMSPPLLVTPEMVRAR
uniref:BRO1 domain-containing protein n=3 Tax=Physcomitrium patens TaxID=3218 RepID=A0A2K1J896_PHYPA|nr:uncharacterized protein LOC112293079 isoform X2 [Physcomitrium patens]PNR37744.1 hypothetical protein PHYPA_020853 [Physcomitrium patens]|eukprot:XP_024397908.1 uncharacterized protein LOC112293079 isoform X2 [Physcomitrella patens]